VKSAIPNGGQLGKSWPEREHRKVDPLRFSEARVSWIEEKIDTFNAGLGPLDSFVLPGGGPSAPCSHRRTPG